MLREPRLTDGIGARIVHNIPASSTKDVLNGRIMTFAMSANQKKPRTSAQRREPTYRFFIRASLTRASEKSERRLHSTGDSVEAARLRIGPFIF